MHKNKFCMNCGHSQLVHAMHSVSTVCVYQAKALMGVKYCTCCKFIIDEFQEHLELVQDNLIKNTLA